MRILTLPLRLWYVTLTVLLIFGWLTVSPLGYSSYDPRPWHIAQWVWEYHGQGCAVCVEDMTFVRDGKIYRIVLPEKLR